MVFRKASYYEKIEENVACLLCPHACILKEGQTGICRTRFNKNGDLYTKAWGNLCSLSMDPIEKKPLFHFLPSTNTLSIAIEGCTFRCLNCQNFSISQVSPEAEFRDVLEPEEVVSMAISKNCRSISYTYSEPVVYYDYMLETARLAKQKGIKNVMVSNGFLNTKSLRNLCKYLDAANIDLKSFNERCYKELAGGLIQPVLNALKTIKEENVWLEITNLIIPDWTDNIEEMKQMCQWLADNCFSDTPIHFSRFYPTYKLDDANPTPPGIILKAIEAANLSGLKFVYSGNLRENNKEDTFCVKCDEKIIARSGFKVIESKIKNGLCYSCGTKISGVWN